MKEVSIVPKSLSKGEPNRGSEDGRCCLRTRYNARSCSKYTLLNSGPPSTVMAVGSLPYRLTHSRSRVDGWRGTIAGPFPSVPLRTTQAAFTARGSPVICCSCSWRSLQGVLRGCLCGKVDKLPVFSSCE